MAGVIVVFPKSDDAKSIRNLLVRNGYDVAAVCTSGAQALSAADRIGSGVVVCGYKYPDMLYEELYENVMPSFAMLLLASGRALGEGVAEGVVSVAMPLRVQELLSTLDMVMHQLDRRRRKRRRTRSSGRDVSGPGRSGTRRAAVRPSPARAPGRRTAGRAAPCGGRRTSVRPPGRRRAAARGRRRPPRW